MTSIINRSPTEVRRGQVLAEDPLVVRPELVHVGGVLGQHGLRRRTRLLVHLVQGLRPGEHLPAAPLGAAYAVGVPAAQGQSSAARPSQGSDAPLWRSMWNMYSSEPQAGCPAAAMPHPAL